MKYANAAGNTTRFSTLQRVEIAEIAARAPQGVPARSSFSTLQRVEIAEISRTKPKTGDAIEVSVLFNESKLLKYELTQPTTPLWTRFSTLQRVEIAEIHVLYCKKHDYQRVSVLFNESKLLKLGIRVIVSMQTPTFQYSSTSRNC